MRPSRSHLVILEPTRVHTLHTHAYGLIHVIPCDSHVRLTKRSSRDILHRTAEAGQHSTSTPTDQPAHRRTMTNTRRSKPISHRHCNSELAYTGRANEANCFAVSDGKIGPGTDAGKTSTARGSLSICEVDRFKLSIPKSGGLYPACSAISFGGFAGCGGCADDPNFSDVIVDIDDTFHMVARNWV